MEQWITAEILVLMDQRSGFTNENPVEYKRLNTLIQHKTRETKESWMSEQCEELENLQQKDDNFILHRTKWNKQTKSPVQTQM